MKGEGAWDVRKGTEKRKVPHFNGEPGKWKGGGKGGLKKKFLKHDKRFYIYDTSAVQ